MLTKTTPLLELYIGFDHGHNQQEKGVKMRELKDFREKIDSTIEALEKIVVSNLKMLKSLLVDDPKRFEEVLKSIQKIGSTLPKCSLAHQCEELEIYKFTLAYTDPKLASEWHPTKNGDLTPSDVSKHSYTKFWWQCPNDKDHEWEAAVCKRIQKWPGSGCPYCSVNRSKFQHHL